MPEYNLYTVLTSDLLNPVGCLLSHALLPMCNLCPQKIFDPKLELEF